MSEVQQRQYAPLLVHDVPLAGRNLIEASAGTGKTFNITGLYARLILGASIAPGAPSYNAQRGLLPEQILVVTFTKAATAELKDRIRLRLAQLTQTFVEQAPVMVNGAAEPFCFEVWERVQAEQLDPAPLLAQLRLALATLDCAAISTIHSFCQRLLTEQAFEAGFDFARTLLEDETEILTEITQDFWRTDLYAAKREWVELLQARGVGLAYLQKLAARVKNINPALQLPLPAAMSADALQAQQARNQQYWLACQSSWDAAALRDVFVKGIASKTFNGRKIQERWLDGWIAPVADALRSQQPKLNLPEQWERLTKGFIQSALSATGSLPNHAFFAAAEAYWLSAATLKMDQDLQFKYWVLHFGDFVREQLALRKAKAGQMSFDDSINTLAAALQNPVRAQNLADKVSQKYQAALVDEFQDTDPLQFTIIDRLFGHALSDGTRPPFFMVGDPKQAIYAFRGADVYAYLGARAQADACYSIDTNFRSDAPIVQFVNTLFAPADAFVESKITHPTIKPKHSGASKLHCDDGRGAVHAFVFEGGNPEGAEKMLFAATADEIAALLNAASHGMAKLGERALSPRDIAVLVPSHRQANEVRKALLKRGVAAVMQTRESVFASAEARGLCAMLAAIEAPAQTGLLRKALVSSVMGYSVADLMALQLDDAAWQGEVENLQTWRDEWRKFGFMAMFRRWLVEAEIASRVLQFADGERRLTNLLHVAELVQNESRSRPKPALLLAWLMRQIAEPSLGSESQQMRLESDADRVRLVTIHASKGLEYPVVFCPFAWKGKKDLLRDTDMLAFHDPADGHALKIDVGTSELAAHKTQAEHEAYAEALRLLYVAVTRAKHRLYLAFPALDKASAVVKNAALTQLLRDEGGVSFRGQLKDLDAAKISTAFARLGQGMAVPLTVSELPATQRFTGRQGDAADLLLGQLSPRFGKAPWSLAAQWRLASFTSLTRAYGASDALAEVGADHDAHTTLPSLFGTATVEQMRFSFARGSKAGTTLHAVLETEDFCRGDAASLAANIEKQMLKSGLPLSDNVASETAAWLLDVLAAPIELPTELQTELSKGVLRLNQLSARQRLNEWQFLLGCKSVDIAAFCRVLARPEFNVEPRFIAAAQRLKPEKFAGYLNGFVDLVFYWQGQYFIADYKSNHLGDELACYAPDQLIDVMSDSHYYLQYLLYVCAWHRHMQARQGSAYDYSRDFGGVLYLFIRGMSSQFSNNGVYMDIPSIKLIEALNATLK